MNSQLVYHSTSNSQNTPSPFDQAIRNIIRDNDVLIVCPYLGVSYLEHTLKLCKSWRILTDVISWIESYENNIKQLRILYDFLKCNSQVIHHYPNIHAKVVIGTTMALVGSANLTIKGVLERTEMGVLLNDPSQIQELKTWFESLWAQTDPLSTKELERIDEYLIRVQQREKSNQQTHKLILKSRVRLRRTRRSPSDNSVGSDRPVVDELDLPEIDGIVINGKKHTTIKEIAQVIAKEETIRWQYARTWIYQLIRRGKITAFWFANGLLLDQEGLSFVWAARQTIRTGRRMRMNNEIGTVKLLKTDEWLTIEQMSKRTGESARMIMQLVREQKIQAYKLDRVFVFHSSTVPVVCSLPERSRGRKLRPSFNEVDFATLRPLTAVEIFVLEAREKQEPPLTWQKITDLAREAGLTKSRTRNWSSLLYDRAATKRKLFQERGINPYETEHIEPITIRKNRAGRPKRTRKPA